MITKNDCIDTLSGRAQDLLDSAATAEDPYPAYRRLRELAPVVEAPDGTLLATSYAACDEILRDTGQWRSPRPFHDRDHPPQRRVAYAVQELFRAMITLNPPSHAAQRKPAVRFMTARALTEIEPRIRELAREHVESLAEEIDQRGHGDFASTVAVPFAGTVLCLLLGLPRGDAAELLEPSRAALATQEVRPGRAALSAAGEGMAFILDHLRRRIAETPAAPRLIDRLRESEARDDLPEGYAARVGLMFLVGGVHITANHLSGAVLALVRHPLQARLLGEAPALPDGTVDELLRYVPPVHLVQRQAARDGVLCGHPVRSGQMAQVVLGAASRDPELVDAPERLNVTRYRPRHLAFGLGAHHCLGATLARIESAALLPPLLARIPRPTLAGNVVWRLGRAQRGIDRLPLAHRVPVDREAARPRQPGGAGAAVPR